MTNERSPGQVAYEGYVDRCGGRSLVNGDPLPAWSDQRQDICQAWEAAADAVRRQDPGDMSSGVKF